MSDSGFCLAGDQINHTFVLQLCYFREIVKFRNVDPELSEVVEKKLNGNHTWMLTEEFVPIVLASSLIKDSTKSAIAKKIMSFPEEELADLPLGKPKLPVLSVDTALEDLVGRNSQTFFLISDTKSFLMKDVSSWSDDPFYKKFVEIVCHLKVINDTAERGVKLLSDYLPILTKNEDLRQKILHLVEHNRNLWKDGSKSEFFSK